LLQGNPAQRYDPETQERLLQETRQSVERLEAKHGLPFQRIHQAIDEGTLVETFEICRWIFQYNWLHRAETR
jgi:hypothetical protein